MVQTTASSTETKIVKTTCAMCGVSCGLDVQVRDGRVVKIGRMPESIIRSLCVKSGGMLSWLYSPERVTHPMKKSNGRWVQISWEATTSP